MLPDHQSSKTKNISHYLVSYKSITLGVDGGKRAKDPIRNQSPSILSNKSQVCKAKTLKDRNTEALYKLLHQKLKRDPERTDLLKIHTNIKSLDPTCPTIPGDTCSKEELIN